MSAVGTKRRPAACASTCPVLEQKRTRRAAITGPIRREDDQECFFQLAD
jgi:hypothetical protein